MPTLMHRCPENRLFLVPVVGPGLWGWEVGAPRWHWLIWCVFKPVLKRGWISGVRRLSRVTAPAAAVFLRRSCRQKHLTETFTRWGEQQVSRAQRWRQSGRSLKEEEMLSYPLVSSSTPGSRSQTIAATSVQQLVSPAIIATTSQVRAFSHSVPHACLPASPPGPPDSSFHRLTRTLPLPQSLSTCWQTDLGRCWSTERLPDSERSGWCCSEGHPGDLMVLLLLQLTGCRTLDPCSPDETRTWYLL